MKIKYSDGSIRITANDRETIERIICNDVGASAIIHRGLVWSDEQSSEEDDGSKAVAKLYNDDGEEFTDEIDSL